jgi:hypothetical protein
MSRVASMALVLGLTLLGGPARGTSVLFDFDGGPLHAGTPLTQVAGSVTAQFTATGSGYSIQEANVLGFTPAGFSGYVLYPNSVFASDLTISFDQGLTDISLLYAPEEYATDSSATLRITAYLGSTLVGTNTATADPPGTWPTATLAFSSSQPFDRVVVHYDAPPPTGGDYGPVFMVDDVAVSPIPEPASLAATGVGLALLGWIRTRRVAGRSRRIA